MEGPDNFDELGEGDFVRFGDASAAAANSGHSQVDEADAAGEAASASASVSAASSSAAATAAATATAQPEPERAGGAVDEESALREELWSEFGACEEQCTIAAQMMEIMEKEQLESIPESLFDIIEFLDVIRPRLLKLSQEGTVGDLDEKSFGKVLELNDTVCSLLTTFIEVEQRMRASKHRPRVIARKASAPATLVPSSVVTPDAGVVESTVVAPRVVGVVVSASDGTSSSFANSDASLVATSPVDASSVAGSTPERSDSFSPTGGTAISGTPPPDAPPPSYDSAVPNAAPPDYAAATEVSGTTGTKSPDADSFSLDDL